MTEVKAILKPVLTVALGVVLGMIAYEQSKIAIAKFKA